MSKWEVSTKGGGNIPILEDDMYDAICVWMIDLGTQTDTFDGGDVKAAHKALFTWAIDGEFVDVDGEKRPRIVSKEYTVSLHERANLRKDLEGWRGKAFDAEGLDTFDISKVLEKACRILVGHSKTGKSNKVEAVKPPKKQVAVPNGLSVLFFKLDDYEGGPLPEGIPEWVQKKIMESPEYQSKQGRTQTVTIAGGPDEDSPDDVDIPF